MSEYVTVVSVDLVQSPSTNKLLNGAINGTNCDAENNKKSSFVTVLSINNQTSTTISTSENPLDGEIVTVYRLPGERLGFGLKFQGGTQTNEKVQRLFIQSCDVDSPASRARASWGPLGESDEILKIDHEPVTNMTRIECVKCLKDKNVAINLLVRRNLTKTVINSNDAPKKRPLPPPPPMVPPRKINKKPAPREPLHESKSIIMDTPVAAEMYLNTLVDDEISHHDESDETGSTISTIISNFSSESDLSLLSSNASSNDLTKILTKPFQLIEREFNVNSTNIMSTTAATTGSSFDSLLMFNESEPNEFADEMIKIDMKTVNGNYENINANIIPSIDVDDDQMEHSARQYENVDIKLPPIPRPRSISMPPEACEIINVKSPTKTIESWLNDANQTINGTATSDDGNKVVERSNEQKNYEPIKFECFAAGDDEEEKLGPPELLNISEAYFNFSWCGNNTNGLPTIGEAEEELSSIEQRTMDQSFATQKLVAGPIFIVNTFHDNESDNDANSSPRKSSGIIEIPAVSHIIHHRVDMEINNNNSHYLSQQHCEDKGDNCADKRMQCEMITSKAEAVERRSLVSAKVNGNSMKIQATNLNQSVNKKSIKMASCDEFVKQSNFDFEHEIAEKTETFINESEINNQIAIRHDSERLEMNCVDEMIQSVTSQNTLIDEVIQQSNDETTKVMTSQSTQLSSLHHQQLTSGVKTDQKQLSTEHFSMTKATESSRMPPDGHEISHQRMIPNNGAAVKCDNTIDLIKSQPTTKATAIVAPLLPRKAPPIDDITNFIDTKPPFKSSTLGRHKPINWRNKDEKSEKSVRDKIAMFSNSTSDISLIMPRTPFKEKSNMSQRNNSIAKSTENIFSSSDAKSKAMKKKAMSVENLDDYEEEEVELRDKRTIEMNYKPINKPMSLHSPAISTRPLSHHTGRTMSVDDLNEPYERPYSTATLPSRPPPTLTRNISFSGYTNSQVEENRQKSITNLLESRKRGMSKLRGLVIPEKMQDCDLQPEQKVFGLPVIRSKECDLIDSTPIFNRSISMPFSIGSKPIRKQSSNDVQPKIIRAAPRRSLDGSRNDAQPPNVKPPAIPPVKPPRTSLILSPKSVTTDESDTESCLSSRKSTPPISPVTKKPLTRTFSSETNTSTSSNSTLTSGSGSQASCSSNVSAPEARKSSSASSKPSSEVLSNRKSVLASSKSRSGRDCLEKSWRDEDSTDGGIDNDDRRRTPKAKTRSSLINYKLIGPNDNVVDKVINVATYVEVVSSDSDEKPDVPEPIVSTPIKMTIKEENTQPMSDMAKWVRSEATKSIEISKKPEVRESIEIRVTPKVLEGPKKLNLTEIRKNFESKSAISNIVQPAPRTPKEKSSTAAANHNRFSSWDSVASSSSGVSSELLGTGTGTNNSESLQTIQSDFGSFSSFGSSHSLITPQDLQLIIDEADPPLETPEAFVVVLQRETVDSSIGITLAGGSDYEAKEITIHRILSNSPADKDGRLKRGDRLLSINGLSMRGLTHRESLSVLKAPRADVVMVVTRSKSMAKTNSLTKSIRGSMGSLTSLTEKSDSLEVDGTSRKKGMNASRSLEMDLDAISNDSYRNCANYKSNDIDSVKIIKDGAGLGFSIDGGYDSPTGNKPLVIKKIFMGGSAERSSNLKVGDEILEINGISIERHTRIDVWNMIKKFPQGDAVQLTIKRK